MQPASEPIVTVCFTEWKISSSQNFVFRKSFPGNTEQILLVFSLSKEMVLIVPAHKWLSSSLHTLLITFNGCFPGTCIYDTGSIYSVHKWIELSFLKLLLPTRVGCPLGTVVQLPKPSFTLREKWGWWSQEAEHISIFITQAWGKEKLKPSLK